MQLTDFVAEPKVTPMLDVNAPALFKDTLFLNWLNDPENQVFTWHVRGEEPNEYSDVMVYYGTGGEGSHSDMPYWDILAGLWEAHYGRHEEGWIRITNLNFG